jgi:Superinfection immunity protein
MNALANSYFFWIFLIFGLLGLYILPTIIAAIRDVEGLGWIIVINLLPTGVGWLAALIAALMLPRREPLTAVLSPSSTCCSPSSMNTRRHTS